MTQARDLADGKFDTDTLVVSASNDRVGVNNASPDTTMKVNFSSASTAGFGINDTNSGNLGGMLQFYSGSSNGTLRANIMNANNAGVHAALGTSGTVVFGGTSYVAANALDDYEKGTFIVTDNSGAGLSLTQNVTAQYIKIGRLVFVNFYITYPSNSSGTAASITGFPFSSDGYSYLIGRTGNHSANSMVWQLNGGAAIPYYNNNARVNSDLSGSYVLLSGCYYTSQ